jgi:hypothetical protein
LGRYTHKIAIGNHRILKIQDGQVTFEWRDYKDGGRSKAMTLDAFEFIRRFLLHILPPRFVKIRHYGILSCRGKDSKLNRCRELLGVPKTKPKMKRRESWSEFLMRLTGKDIACCPKCGKGRMIRQHEFSSCLSPPYAPIPT